MCGIAGQVCWERGERVSAAALQRAMERLRHRGPDEDGLWIGEGGQVGLAHTRLAIVDLAGGRQPMANEDGSVHLVFNGEIYNHVELRDELQRQGHRFRTNCDTEVLVHSYEQYGTDLFGRLVGMFAFALWDSGRGQLLLARDRLGQKPLFFAREGRRLAFASEIKALLPLLAGGRRLVPEAIYHYLTFQYVPGDLCAFEGIEKLGPGQWLLCRRATDGAGWQLERRPYWQVPAPGSVAAGSAFDGDFDQAAAELRRRLRAATQLRLRSDVPVGVLLSGGTDSSVVVGLMAELGVRPIRTYTVSFAPAGPDERRFAAAVARRFGTRHHELTVAAPLPELAGRIVDLYDEPFADTSAIPTYLICQLARQHVKVVLTGDGGDESLLGYDRYEHYRRYLRQRRWLRALMCGSGLRALAVWLCPVPGRRTWRRRLRTLATLWDAEPAEAYQRWLAAFAGRLKQRLCKPALRRAVAVGGPSGPAGDRCRPPLPLHCSAARIAAGLQARYRRDWPAAAAAFDMATYLPDAVLTKVDRASMAHGLECRSPMLDHRVVEFLATLPTEWKLHRRHGAKWILRYACRDLLPPEVMRRTKIGFGSPVGVWFRHDWRALLESACMPTGPLTEWLDPHVVRELVEEHRTGEVDHTYRLWTLFCLNRVQERIGSVG